MTSDDSGLANEFLQVPPSLIGSPGELSALAAASAGNSPRTLEWFDGFVGRGADRFARSTDASPRWAGFHLWDLVRHCDPSRFDAHLEKLTPAEQQSLPPEPGDRRCKLFSGWLEDWYDWGVEKARRVPGTPDAGNPATPDAEALAALCGAYFALARVAFYCRVHATPQQRIKDCGADLQSALAGLAQFLDPDRLLPNPLPALGANLDLSQQFDGSPTDAQRQWRVFVAWLSPAAAPPTAPDDPVTLAGGPHVLAARHMAGHALGWMLNCLPEATVRRRISILFQRPGVPDQPVRGARVPLEIAAHPLWGASPRGAGLPPSLYPDPVALGVMLLTSDWLRSIQLAWQYASRDADHQFAKYDLWRNPLGPTAWRIVWPIAKDHAPASDADPLQRPEVLSGDSASGAAAALLVCQRLAIDPDPGTCLSAALLDVHDDQGRLTGALGDVNAKWDKLTSHPPRLLTHGATPSLREEAARLNVALESDITTVEQALGWIAFRAQHVIAFLQAAGQNVLYRYLAFLPERVGPDEVFEFCLPPRVMTMREWRELRQKHVSGDRDSFTLDQVVRGEGSRTWRPLRNLREGLQVLYGEPGEGKTTALAWLFAKACQETVAAIKRSGLDHSETRLPLILRLESFRDDRDKLNERLGRCETGEKLSVLLHRALHEVTSEAWGSGWPRESDPVVRWLHDKLRRREYLLLLDAFDELPHQQREPLGREVVPLCTPSPPRGRVRLSISSRVDTEVTALGRHDEAGDLRIAPFEERQVGEYLKRYFGPAATKLSELVAKQLRKSPGPRELTRHPLFLALYAHRALAYRGREQQLTELPHTRSEMIKGAIRELFARRYQRRLREWCQSLPGREEHDFRCLDGTRNVAAWNDKKLDLLTELAWKFCEPGGQPRLFDDGDFQKVCGRVLPEVDSRRVLAELSASGDGLLLLREPEKYGFLLRSFHDYLVARWLARHCSQAPTFPTIVQEKMGIAGRYDPREHSSWLNVWCFLAEQLPEGQDQILAHLLPPPGMEP